MIRARVWRLAAAASALVVATAMSTGGATAADTRLIYVGSGPVDTPENIAATNHDLDYTPVTAGGATATNVIVKSIDNQTLTHVVVTFANLPAGFSIADISGADAGFCAGWTATGATCSFGNLAKNQSRTFTVVFNAATAGSSAPVAGISFNESGNPNGGNTHQETAEDLGFTVGAASCEVVSTYVRGNGANGAKSVETCGLADANNGNHQSSKVSFPSSLTTITLSETAGVCPFDSCVGDLVTADIVGDSTSDVITWTIVIDLAAINKTDVQLNKLIVSHYNDAGVETPAGGIANTKKNACKPGGVNCIESATIVDNVLTVIYRSSGNGGTRVH
jgi:hypothetical protein